MIGFLAAVLLMQPPPSTTETGAWKPKLHRGAPPAQGQIDAAREKAKARGLALSGVHVPVDAKALSKGSWHKLKDGRAVWMLRLESPGAQAIRLQFRDFAVGKGMVWVHAAGQTSGPYTGQGPHGDGEFWTDTLDGATVTLEFVPAAAKPAKLPFRVENVSHQL